MPYIVLKNLETLFFTFHVLGVNRTFFKKLLCQSFNYLIMLTSVVYIG